MLSPQVRPDPMKLGGEPGEKLSDALYASILEDVIFRPASGEGRIYPKEISERFKVSATPVREALMRLAAEGYIQSIPRRGFHIRKPSREQVTDLWQVRMGLETTAGELAIERLRNGSLPADPVEQLRAIVEDSISRFRKLSSREQIDLNSKLHRGIVELSGNQLLVSLYRGIQLQVFSSWVRRGVQSWRDRLESEAEEHRAIIAALAARDPDAYRAATRAHLERSLRDALHDLEVTQE